MTSENANSPPDAPEPMRSADRWTGFVLLGSLLLCFAPLFRWLGGKVQTHNQLSQSLLVFGFVVILAGFWDRLPCRPVWRLDRLTIGLVLASYALVAATVLTPYRLLVLPAFALSLAAGALFVFGAPLKRLILAAAVSFGLFLLLTIFLEAFDWPLRVFAGEGSAQVLQWCGQSVELGLAGAHQEPRLILVAAGRPFHVAPECNGYGILGTTLLIATFLVLYRPINAPLKVGLIAASVGIAYIANVLRIVVIIFLAPKLPAQRYDLMHEAVGIFFFYACLGAVAWMILRLPRNRNT
jgi:exosortase/archaeosortase family protein